MITLRIRGIPPSVNKWRGMHHYTEAKQKKYWEAVVIKEVAVQLGRVRPIRRARCTYIYFFPTKIRHDPSNYTPKWIEDGLVKAGVLADDSFDHVELAIKKGGVDRTHPRVEIQIEPLGGD